MIVTTVLGSVKRVNYRRDRQWLRRENDLDGLLLLASNRSSHLSREPCTYCILSLEEQDWLNPDWDFYDWQDSDLQFPTPSPSCVYKGSKIPRLKTINFQVFTSITTHYFLFSTIFSLLSIPRSSRTSSYFNMQFYNIVLALSLMAIVFAAPVANPEPIAEAEPNA